MGTAVAGRDVERRTIAVAEATSRLDEASLRALARKAEVRFDRVLPVVTSTVVGDAAGGDGRGDGVTSGGCRSRRGTTPSTALEPEA